MLKTKGVLSLLLALLLSIPIFIFGISASGADTAFSEQRIYDMAGLFNADEIAKINSLCLSKTEKSGAGYFVATTDGYYNGEHFLYDFGYSSNDDIILLVITKEGSTVYYDMYTYGNAWDKISDNEVDAILDSDDVYDNLKGWNLEEGTLAFINYSERAYSGWFGFGRVVIWSLIIALVIAAICAGSVVAQYKMKTRPTNYPLEHYTKLSLKESDDIFIGKNVTRVVISSSSGGSRGGGGGGRGGGGGHRGGR